MEPQFFNNGEPPIVEMVVDGMDIVEQMVRRLEATIAEGGWDQQPHFFNVLSYPHSETCTEAHEHDKLGALALTEVLMPPFCYTDPASGLGEFLSMLGLIAANDQHAKEVGFNPSDVLKVLNSLIPNNFYAFGMVHEGWTLPAETPWEEVKEHAEAHTISEHPNRIESRMATFATTDGRLVMLERQRDQFPRYVELDPTQMSVTGRVPDAIRRITSLFGDFDTFRAKMVAQHAEGNLN